MRRPLIVLLAATALLVAGCGGDDEPSASPGTEAAETTAVPDVEESTGSSTTVAEDDGPDVATTGPGICKDPDAFDALGDAINQDVPDVPAAIDAVDQLLEVDDGSLEEDLTLLRAGLVKIGEVLEDVDLTDVEAVNAALDAGFSPEEQQELAGTTEAILAYHEANCDSAAS